MRFYTFNNMYISSLQIGLQSAHVLAELFIKYPHLDYADENSTHHDIMLYDWADNHKTMILLNGGYSQHLRELYEFFSLPENPYPFAKFHEGEDALDGALTSVGIILPEKIYASGCTKELYEYHCSMFPSRVIAPPLPMLSSWETQLILKLTEFSLAR